MGTAADIGNKALSISRQIWAFLREQITFGRIVLVLYVALVALGFIYVSGRDKNKYKDQHYLALRYLGKNTRLTEALLEKPADLSVEDRFWIERELKDLRGKYLNSPVNAGCPVTKDNVRTWPELTPAATVPLELQSEPNWVSFNEGAVVQVWSNNSKSIAETVVLAIVPSGSGWLALLDKTKLSQELISSKETLNWRLYVVAGTVPSASPCK